MLNSYDKVLSPCSEALVAEAISLVFPAVRVNSVYGTEDTVLDRYGADVIGPVSYRGVTSLIAVDVKTRGRIKNVEESDKNKLSYSLATIVVLDPRTSPESLVETLNNSRTELALAFASELKASVKYGGGFRSAIDRVNVSLNKRNCPFKLAQSWGFHDHSITDMVLNVGANNAITCYNKKILQNALAPNLRHLILSGEIPVSPPAITVNRGYVSSANLAVSIDGEWIQRSLRVPLVKKGKEFFNRLAGPKPKSMERLNEEELRRVTQLLSPQIRNEIRVSRLSR